MFEKNESYLSRVSNNWTINLNIEKYSTKNEFTKLWKQLTFPNFAELICEFTNKIIYNCFDWELFLNSSSDTINEINSSFRLIPKLIKLSI